MRLPPTSILVHLQHLLADSLLTVILEPIGNSGTVFPVSLLALRKHHLDAEIGEKRNGDSFKLESSTSPGDQSTQSSLRARRTCKATRL